MGPLCTALALDSYIGWRETRMDGWSKHCATMVINTHHRTQTMYRKHTYKFYLHSLCDKLSPSMSHQFWFTHVRSILSVSVQTGMLGRTGARQNEAQTESCGIWDSSSMRGRQHRSSTAQDKAAQSVMETAPETTQKSCFAININADRKQRCAQCQQLRKE